MQDDISLYADFAQDLSEMMSINERIGTKVDELRLTDTGFLKTYEDFSFTSTSQVQNQNVTHIQSVKTNSLN